MLTREMLLLLLLLLLINRCGSDCMPHVLGHVRTDIICVYEKKKDRTQNGRDQSRAETDWCQLGGDEDDGAGDGIFASWIE